MVLGPANGAAFHQCVGDRGRLAWRAINAQRQRVDMCTMPGLLAKLADRFCDHDHDRDVARHCLEHIAQIDGVAELESTRATSSTAGVMRARVFGVGSDDFVIERPKVANATQQLVRNETLRLTISEENQLLCGETHVIGRTRFAQNGETVYGYRLSLPEQLSEPKQRVISTTAAPKIRHFVVQAELRCLRRDIPIRGVVTGLSEKMVHVRSMNAPPDLNDGDRMTFVAELPQPLGAVEQMVQVSSARPVGVKSMTMLGLKFIVPMREARSLLDGGPIRWG